MAATEVSRRSLLAAPAMGLALASAGRANGADQGGVRLVPRPTRVFKTADSGHEGTESWIFSLMAQTAPGATLAERRLEIDLLSGGVAVKRITLEGAGLTALVYHPHLGPSVKDGMDPAAPYAWPFGLRIRATEPAQAGVDAMSIRLTATGAGGAEVVASVSLPIETYVQKAALIFPFKGQGIVLQAGATNGGHRNRSGEFALDACGLDDAWSICAPGDGKRNEDYRGWGRPILAPADGVVVRVRNDRPDQPVGDASDPAFYAPEYKDGGDPGNFVVIDHGGGEFSMIAHFQAGSLRLAAGDRVRQGQAIGKLGHAGDTNTPHVHYQLQAGPDWEYADALPCRFTNVDQRLLDRGTYFTAT